jgi:hypothetical protein
MSTGLLCVARTPYVLTAASTQPRSVQRARQKDSEQSTIQKFRRPIVDGPYTILAASKQRVKKNLFLQHYYPIIMASMKDQEQMAALTGASISVMAPSDMPGGYEFFADAGNGSCQSKSCFVTHLVYSLSFYPRLSHIYRKLRLANYQ